MPDRSRPTRESARLKYAETHPPRPICGPMKRPFVRFSRPSLIQRVIRHSAQLLRQWAAVLHSGATFWACAGLVHPSVPYCRSPEAERITPAFFSPRCDEAHVTAASHSRPRPGEQGASVWLSANGQVWPAWLPSHPGPDPGLQLKYTLMFIAFLHKINLTLE